MGRIKVTYKYDHENFGTSCYYNSVMDSLKSIHKHLSNAEDVCSKTITNDGKITGSFYDRLGFCEFVLEEVSEEEFSKEMNQ